MYMSPELIINNEYEFEVDIWSMGVITYILLSGDSPFHGDDKQQLFREVLTKPITMDEKAWDNISDEAKDFINQALNRDQQGRWTA